MPSTLPTVSVVIPVLNEQDNLRGLLAQLAKQSHVPDEIIVADAGSVDSSKETAAALGAIVVQGGTPSIGRSNGAKRASSEWVFFLDADTRLPFDSFIEKTLVELEERRISAAVADNRPWYSENDKGRNSRAIRLWDRMMMNILSSAQHFWLKMGFPVGQAVFIATKRSVFLELDGFDQQAEPFEDSAYLLKVHRNSPAPAGSGSAVGVLSGDLFVYVSMRRYDKMGRVFFPAWSGLRGSLGRWLLGRELPIKDYWEINKRAYGRKHRQGKNGESNQSR